MNRKIPLLISLILAALFTLNAQQPIPVPKRNKPATSANNSKPTQKASNKSKKKGKPTRGSINGHEWVDLGLPSGLKWATMNIGSLTPYDPGLLFSWGETSTKDSFSDESSVLYGIHTNCISKNPRYDAARTNWGGTWELPMEADYKELDKYCKKEPIDLRGGGLAAKFTGPNGNYIILPANLNFSATVTVPETGVYWTSTPSDISSDNCWAKTYGFSKNAVCYFISEQRGMGCAIRPVSE